MNTYGLAAIVKNEEITAGISSDKMTAWFRNLTIHNII